MKKAHWLLRTVLPPSVMKKLVMSRFFLIARRASGLSKWVVAGKFDESNFLVKVLTIRHFAQIYQTSVFVETGTYLGDMVDAQEPNFDRLFTIELSSELYDRALSRFRSNQKISILHGDSAVQIPSVIKMIDEPALFWLDAHFSQGITAKGSTVTPILDELAEILGRPLGDVILIDDMHLFNGSNDYPTINQLSTYVTTNFENRSVKLLDQGIICIT